MLGRRVLVIDDEENLRHYLQIVLGEAGYLVETAQDGKEAIEMMHQQSWDIILCDIRMPNMDGIAFLKEVRAQGLDGTIIMMSAYGTIETAIEAMKIGAYDYVSKPFNADEITLVLKKAEERERLREENIRLKKEVLGDYPLDNIVAQSQVMKNIFEFIKKVSQFKSAVLITGESGTGKEMVARAIHYHGARKDNHLISVNCGAIPENLLETELFGHAKGAFTNAIKSKKGLFELAHQGTMFLDEVGELPLSLQVKLLRVLQDGEIRRVGDTASSKVDVNLIAATAKNLSAAVKGGTFREDLYYRLNVLPIHLPPLRERAEDISPLVDHFISLYNKKLGLRIKGATQEAMASLLHYSWPGNVRELENIVERAMILSETDTIGVEALAMHLQGEAASMPVSSGLSIKSNMKEMEINLIKQALMKTSGNRVRAARILEISHKTLLYKLKDYSLEDYGKKN